MSECTKCTKSWNDFKAKEAKALADYEMMLKEKCGNGYIYQRPLPKNHDDHVHKYIKYTFIDESDKSDSK